MTRIPLARRRQRRELVPGEVIRFRNRRRFFTTASMALAPLAVGIPVFVFTVPPKDGRRFYEVTAAELVIRTAEERRAIPWYEVRHLVHRLHHDPP